MPVAMTMGGATYYLSYDQVGSLRLVADGSGNVVKRISYDSFGNILEDTNPSFTTPFGFAGGLHDRDTGLVRFGYRDYDPEVGRWTAKDPIGFDGGDTDLYGYVGGNVRLVELTRWLGMRLFSIDWSIVLPSPASAGGATQPIRLADSGKAALVSMNLRCKMCPMSVRYLKVHMISVHNISPSHWTGTMNLTRHGERFLWQKCFLNPGDIATETNVHRRMRCRSPQ